MRCQECNKFVSFEEGEPEVSDLEVDGDGNVTASVRVVNQCAECSTDLTEAELTLEGKVDVPAGHEDHELEVEESASERVSRQGYFKGAEFVPKYGRYGKMFYGAQVTATVTCSCGGLAAEVEMQDYVQSSEMGEC